jgi:hypothetical protein
LSAASQRWHVAADEYVAPPVAPPDPVVGAVVALPGSDATVLQMVMMSSAQTAREGIQAMVSCSSLLYWP